ncbi:MAG TPA: hypothetical protein DDW50_01010 [Firmicutes bacterium]|nr:hypothetical protein [Bacillota bacterium]
MQDELIRWMIAGVIGFIVKDILGAILFWGKVVSYHIAFIAADIFMNSPDIYSPEGWILGTVTDLLIGGILGIGIGMFLKWKGPGFYGVKGIFLAMVIWLLFIGGIMHALQFIFSIVLTRFSDLFYSLIAHVVYGLFTSYLIVRLTPKSIPS